VTPAVVALGGGHGLAASLTALRRVTDRLTAVVTVADNGGSSGRLRRELGVLPPGDLRMALAALCSGPAGAGWDDLLQHRFEAPRELHGHPVGNLLLVALWERAGGDIVAGLRTLGTLVGAQGVVLPMATVPLDIVARVRSAGGPPDAALTEVVGQVEVATTTGEVVDVRLEPMRPPACPEALAAITSADWVVLGPGSWYSSVIPHLLVPELAEAIVSTAARRLVVVNLEPQVGETAHFGPETHLEVLAQHAPGLRLDVVLADSRSVPDPERLRVAAAAYGADVVLAPLRVDDGSARHDHARLAAAYDQVMTSRALYPVVATTTAEPDRRDRAWR